MSFLTPRQKARRNYIKHKRPCVITLPNTENRVENTTRSGLFLTNFKVFEMWSNAVSYGDYQAKES